MNLWTTARLAVSRIWATKTRSTLTMLGVIIGVASLVALTSVASGATSGITSTLGSLGATTVTVRGTTATALTEADAEAVRTVTGVRRVAATVTAAGSAVHGARDSSVTLTGVSPDYAAIAKPAVAVGSFLPSLAGGASARDAVLSASAAQSLGVTATDIGSTIALDAQPFTVAGVLDDANGIGATGTVYVAMADARRLFAQAPYVSSLSVEARTEAGVGAVQASTDALLRSRYGLTPADDAPFSTTNLSSLLDSINTVRSLLSVLLGGIASISLVVGGIGIMNIMLVSVRERTREIGVRRAIGARRSQILTQFLVEAVVLSVVGGVIGLVFGLGFSALIALAAGWAFTVSGTTVAVALIFSLLVGLVFGVWPARTAARLQPVDALRFE